MREESSSPVKASPAPKERVGLELWSYQVCTLCGKVLSARQFSWVPASGHSACFPERNSSPSVLF